LIETDERNTIPQATNCVLVRTGGQNVLIDAGYGSKFSEKQRTLWSAEPDDPLAISLAAFDLSLTDVDLVILSHLHFDHAGGATRLTEDGTLESSFPNAEFVVQQKEWEVATADLPELRTAYPQENLTPLGESGQLRLIDGDIEICPGIRALVTGGHTEAHMALVISDGGETAVYLGDICPTWRHLKSLWGMSYDVDLLQVRRFKPKLLAQVADGDWLALSDHDPDHAAARIAPDPRSDFVATELIEAL
jgi:glyoxylase-like metal-dependent hydrolase (beta-lactamase superfamily II)